MNQMMIMQNIILVFLLLLLILITVYAVGKGPVKRKRQKIYACGEDIPPEKLNVPQDSFYAVLARTLRIGWLRRMHTGRLSDYVVWIVMGLLFILVVLTALW
jgi:hypothetical protein